MADGTQVSHFMDEDPSTSPHASYIPDMSSLDSSLDQLRELCALPDTQAAAKLEQWLEEKHPRNEAISLAASMFRLFLCQILFSRRPRQEAWLWAIAVGMECAEGKDMQTIGDMFHISKQAISKQVNNRADKFGLPRSRYMNSQAAREAHSRAKRDKKGIQQARRAIRSAM
jgi:hypothetical protein